MAIQELVGVGWTIYHYDEPDRGVLGYHATRQASGEGTELEEHFFQWSLFGQYLKPDVEVIEATDLVAFIRNEPAEGLFLCDDPRQRLLGFVSYQSAPEGLSVVRQARLTGVMHLSAEDRSFLRAERDRLLTLSEKRREKASGFSNPPLGGPDITLT